MFLQRSLFSKFFSYNIVYAASSNLNFRTFTESAELVEVFFFSSGGAGHVMRHPDFMYYITMEPNLKSDIIEFAVLYDRNLFLNSGEVSRGLESLLNSLVTIPKRVNGFWTDLLLDPYDSDKMLTLEAVNIATVSYKIISMPLTFDKELGFPHTASSSDSDLWWKNLTISSTLLKAEELISVDDLKTHGPEFFYEVKDALLFKLEEQLAIKAKNADEIDAFNFIRVSLQFYVKLKI